MKYLLSEEQMHKFLERLGEKYIEVHAAIADDWWEEILDLWRAHCAEEASKEKL